MSHCAGADEATTYPPTITIAICMVNGTRVQNAAPPWMARFAGLSPSMTPNTKTITTPRNAKTSASGNQRSLAAASRSAARSNGLLGAGGMLALYHDATIEAGTH